MRHEAIRQTRFFEIVCDATFEDVRMVLKQMDMRLKAQGVDPDKRGTAQMVLAEAMNNIVEHAYADTPKTGILQLWVDADKDSLRVKLVDGGAPMPWNKVRNPRTLRRPLSLKYAKEGGYGWSIITTLATDLGYERINDQNHLSFRIDAPDVSAPEPGARRRDARLFGKAEKSA